MLRKSQSASTQAILSALLTLTLASGTSAAAREKVLHTFTGGTDGAGPNSPLIFDSVGNLYGTTRAGGAYENGAVFELTPSGSGWTETVLYSFINFDDGVIPIGPVLFDKEGNLYGLAQQGGDLGHGTVFELSPVPSGGWTKKTIYAFAGGSDGTSPNGALVPDGKGNLYGVTLTGGTGPCQYNGPGCGTIFKLKRSHGTWKETVVFRFSGGPGGQAPLGLTLDKAGNFYGTTAEGGSGGVGIVFKLSHSSGQWMESVLHAFTGGSDGSSPNSPLIFDNAGILYGTTTEGSGGGCQYGCGLVYELRPTAKGKWQEMVLHRFEDDGHEGGDSLCLSNLRSGRKSFRRYGPRRPLRDGRRVRTHAGF